MRFRLCLSRSKLQLSHRSRLGNRLASRLHRCLCQQRRSSRRRRGRRACRRCRHLHRTGRLQCRRHCLPGPSSPWFYSCRAERHWSRSRPRRRCRRPCRCCRRPCRRQCRLTRLRPVGRCLRCLRRDRRRRRYLRYRRFRPRRSLSTLMRLAVPSHRRPILHPRHRRCRRCSRFRHCRCRTTLSDQLGKHLLSRCMSHCHSQPLGRILIPRPHREQCPRRRPNQRCCQSCPGLCPCPRWHPAGNRHLCQACHRCRRRYRPAVRITLCRPPMFRFRYRPE